MTSEIAVALDRDVADEIEDAFLGGGRTERRDEDQERQKQGSDRDHALAPGKVICGAAPCVARSSSSKNGSSLNPNGRATSTSGNDWMLMLRLRTVPL